MPFRNIGPGTYEAEVAIPAAGTWELEVSLRTTETEDRSRTLGLVVR